MSEPNAVTSSIGDNTSPDNNGLSAILPGGNKWHVKISINHENVSPPNSDVDDDMMMMEEEDHDERANSLEQPPTSSATTDDRPTMEEQGQERSEDNNTNDDGRNTPPRRGRSASMGGDDNDDNNNYSRENSSSSDVVGAGGRSNFEASLLLGIATESTSSSGGGGGGGGATTSTSNGGGGNNNTSGIILPTTPQLEKDTLTRSTARDPYDPSTLPTSMTSFLDMLTEEQRRVRHRYIPGVEGFRKLYKGEVRADMSEARRTKRKVSSTNTNMEVVNEDAVMMEVEEPQNTNVAVSSSQDVTSGENNTLTQDSTIPSDDNGEEEEDDDEDGLPNREAFIAPTKESRKYASRGQLASLLDNTDFENIIKDTGGGGKKAASTTPSSGSTNEKSPQLVDSLTSFNPPRPQESTSYKTHHRLKRWEANPNEVEVDLSNYRKTVSRTRSELHLAKDERERIERVSSLMRNHFMAHICNYRKEMMAITEGMVGVNAKCSKLDDEYNGKKELRSMSTRGTVVKDMKDVIGTLKSLGEDIKGVKVGEEGVGTNTDWRVSGVGGVCSKEEEKKTGMASGWLLVGDDIIVSSTGEEGVVVSVTGPQLQKKKTDDDKKVKKDSSPKKTGDAMDVDTPSKKDTKQSPAKKETAKKETVKKDDSPPVVKPPTISVKLSKTGKVETYSPTEIEFNPKSLPTLILSDPKLAKRWEDMVKTALACGVDHDVLAMEEYIHSSFLKDKAEGLNDDGTTSPKSVTQYDDERSVLSFGSGLVAAPDNVKHYPSVIPMDNLEETVRKVVYEANKPRVIPTMSANLRTPESRHEEMNVLKGKVLQLRNRLGRQKRLRSLNERSLVAGKSRAKKVEGLLLEMQMDLKNLKGRLAEELTQLGIGDGTMPDMSENGVNNENETEAEDGGAPKNNNDETGGSSLPGEVVKGATSDAAATDDKKDETDTKEDLGISTADNDLERESKRARLDE